MAASQSSMCIPLGKTHKLQVFIDTLPHNMPTFSLISLRGKEEKEILLHFSTNLQTVIKTGHAPLKQVI